jgi:hypothetical protein
MRNVKPLTGAPSPDAVRPMPLKKMAASIAATYGDDGAIIITRGPDGIRVGVHGLDGQELQEALCVAIYHAVSKSLA